MTSPGRRATLVAVLIAVACFVLPRAGLTQVPDRSILLKGQIDFAHQRSGPMVEVYGNEYPFSIEFRGTWLFKEKFGVGIGFALQIREGTGVSPVGQGPVTTLRQAPMFLEGCLRLALLKKQVAVPYIRGGFDAVLWSEEDGQNDPKGVKWGAHLGGGVEIRLPFPELNWEGRLTGNPVLDDVYLHIEAWARSADNFGSPGLDLTAAGVGMGITLLL